MAFCSKCGATLDPNSQFCPSCGTPVATGTQQAVSSAVSSAPSYSAGSQSTMQRPTGITILAILAIIGGLALLAFGAGVSVIAGVFFSSYAAGLSVVLIIFALIDFAVAYAFWTGKTWGWWLGIIAAILDIISIVSFDVFGLIIGILMLYYLTRPHVKLWFHKS